jgi:hypothetical protein
MTTINNEDGLDTYQAEVTVSIAFKKYVIYGDPISDNFKIPERKK